MGKKQLLDSGFPRFLLPKDGAKGAISGSIISSIMTRVFVQKVIMPGFFEVTAVVKCFPD